MSEIDNSWVAFKMGEEDYAIRTKDVLEMVVLNETIDYPESPAHIRGMMNLRGSVFPCIDMRSRMGRLSRLVEINEIDSLLKTRKQDHINWLNELKNCVEEERDFSLTTDPHACGFGKWYDNFKTDNPILTSQLRKFDTPHKEIHAVAEKVLEIAATGDKKSALDIIEKTWCCELAHMKELFDETCLILTEQSREVVILTQANDKQIGLIVDGVSEVLNIEDSDIQDSNENQLLNKDDSILGFALKNGNIKTLLEVSSLVEDD